MKLCTSGAARGSGVLSLSYLVSMSNSTHAHARNATDETDGKAMKVMIETAGRDITMPRLVRVDPSAQTSDGVNV